MKKHFLALTVLSSLSLMACQQTVTPQIKTLGTLELNFDLDAKTVKVQNAHLGNGFTRGVLTSSDVTFTAPSTLGFFADVSNNVNYLSATFQVNNLTAAALNDLSLIAYYKTGNTADTAVKNIVDFNGTPLTPTQINAYAQAVQPVNVPSSIAPSFTVTDSVADLQYFNESELTSLESAANTAGELNTSSNEYLFPYGFIARGGITSRVIPVGNATGSITIGIKLPNNNEPTGNARRFSMTFVVTSEPLGAGVARMTESYEERRGTSSAATRADASHFNIPASNIASNTIGQLSSGVLVNGVRTAGSNTNVQRVLGERAWQYGTSNYDQASGVAVDSSGNTFIAGSTGGALDGNTSAGGNDAFITKYDSSGVKQWTKQIGTSVNEQASGVAVDSSGNAFIAGRTDGGLDGNTNAGGYDAFITKFDSSGVKQWTKQIGTSNSDIATGVAVDSSGNAFIAGYTDGALDGNTNAGNTDAFITKFDSSGVKQWTKQIGTSSGDFAYGVAVDSSGNAFIAGYTNGALDGNTSAGNADAFLTKYNSSGVKQWTKQIGTSSAEAARSVAVDLNGNTFIAGYVAGGFAGVANAGSFDIFLARFDKLTDLYK